MYEIIENQAFKLVGISVRITNLNGQSAKDIGQLADTFFSQQLITKIPNKIGDDVLFCLY